MINKLDKKYLPKIVIDNPRNSKGLDLSDHYPIIINGLGLKIISYNIQFIHSLLGGAEGKKTSAEKNQAIGDIAAYFAKNNADVCCVQELFDEEANKSLEAAMLKNGYVASARVGAKSVSFFNGGVRSFIKSNLAKEFTFDEAIYQHKIDYFIGADALVNKGVIHTSLKKNGTKYHVFNTHLQAYYPNRDHYAEITLAQCVEIKKFIEIQKAKGLIGPDDKIVLCGDFNIPKPHKGEEANHLFAKLTRLMGPQFTFLDYKRDPSGPKYTLSLENSYNTKLVKSSDNDVNLDLGIVYNPTVTASSLIDVELSDIYCDIQMAISHYIRDNATLFTKWLLSKEQTSTLEQFNDQVLALMQHADDIKLENKNPIDDPVWFNQAIQLLKGPSSRAATLQNEQQPIVEEQENTTLETELTLDFVEEDAPLDNLDQCKERFDFLLAHLKSLHQQIHQSYINSPDQHEKVFKTSLMLNHVLNNEGNKFFNNPSAKSFEQFQKACHEQMVVAKKEFEAYSGFWERLNPILKGFIGVLAAIPLLPFIIASVKAKNDFTNTFFSPPPSQKLTEIIDYYEDEKKPLAPPST